MRYTIFIREQVTPKFIMVPDPNWEGIEAPENGYMPAPAPLVEQLNPIPEPVYPPTFVKQVWGARDFDYYSENPLKRAMLWEDTEGTATYPEILAVFSNLPQYVEYAVRKWGNAELSKLAMPYGAAERETWHVQHREAEAWLADNGARIPLISAMCTARDIPVSVMVGKIMENVDLFQYLAGNIMGRQQGLIDQIYQATDIETLWGIMDTINMKMNEI